MKKPKYGASTSSLSVRKRRFTRDDMELTCLALPTFLWFVAFSFLPMAGVLVAFKDFRISPGGFINSFFKSEWVGFKNFEFLFSTNEAFIILRNTILYNLTFMILDVVVPVAFALMLNELLNKRGAKAYQTILFLPFFLSWVVVGSFLYAFLSPDKGLVNNFLEAIGKTGINWYNTTEPWPGIIIFIRVWKEMGYGTVIYLASLTALDRTYYEAAVIDGASKGQQIKAITLPLLKPIIVVMMIMATGKIFTSSFGLFYQIPRDAGALYSVTNVIDTYVYHAMTGMGEIGMSAAAALFQSIMGMLMLLGSNWLVSKYDNENALF